MNRNGSGVSRASVVSGHSPAIAAEAPAADDEGARDRLLLDRVATGDSTAFWALWQRHRDGLYELCLRAMKGHQADAEDALSRGTLKAFRKTMQHAGNIADVRAWLGRLMYNHCMDIHRERSRQARNVETVRVMQTISMETSASRPASPEEVLLHSEMSGHLKVAIDDLPVHLREPFRMRVLHDLPHREIADRLALSPDNVRKRIQLARVLLRQGLEAYMSGRPRPPRRSVKLKKL